MKARPYSSWLSRVFIASMTALSLTGMMQMPLAKRYFLTDLPGMAWTGDFFFVHKLHYVFAAILLFVVGLAAMNWLLEWRDKLCLTPMGGIRVILLGGLLVSGGLRVYRNLPGVTLDPTAILVIEWAHMGFAMLMGVAALAALVRGISAYARYK